MTGKKNLKIWVPTYTLRIKAEIKTKIEVHFETYPKTLFVASLPLMC